MSEKGEANMRKEMDGEGREKERRLRLSGKGMEKKDGMEDYLRRGKKKGVKAGRTGFSLPPLTEV